MYQQRQRINFKGDRANIEQEGQAKATGRAGKSAGNGEVVEGAKRSGEAMQAKKGKAKKE